jgi:hypothetical protein
MNGGTDTRSAYQLLQTEIRRLIENYSQGCANIEHNSVGKAKFAS